MLRGFIVLLVIVNSFPEGREKWKYTKSPTIGGDHLQEQTQIIVHSDTLNRDTLYLVKTMGNIPICYFKNIATGVCFDNECRPLDITVYWNITGRYLGFELPEGEFLSKYDHEPFVASEYERLNDLLADPNLPLGDVSFEQLIELPESDEEPVDGVSGATTPEVAEMVVKEAAYTTYTLWNIVYGSTRDLVASLTNEQLNPELIELILKSPDITDRVWALNSLDQNIELSPILTSPLLEIISGHDFFLAYTAINALNSTHLNSESLQIGLFSIYKDGDYNRRGMIVKKLLEAPYLSLPLVTTSRELLDQLNGKQLGDLLELYAKHGINDLETQQAVAEILKNENRFISRQAYNFLKESKSVDQEIAGLLIEYEERE